MENGYPGSLYYMSSYEQYFRIIVRSVNHIFKNFLMDPAISEIPEPQSAENDFRVSVELSGTLKGELIIHFPLETLNGLTKFFMTGTTARSLKKHHEEVAGEIANLVTGTFANQLQYLNHDIRLSAPEFNDDSVTTRILYDNVNVSFVSGFGGFDVDLYYRLYE